MNTKPIKAGEWFEPHLAFPNRIHTGMTLRDYFAAKAMQTYMNNEVWNPNTYKDAAEKSYRVADAMLEARQA